MKTCILPYLDVTSLGDPVIADTVRGRVSDFECECGRAFDDHASFENHLMDHIEKAINKWTGYLILKTA